MWRSCMGHMAQVTPGHVPDNALPAMTPVLLTRPRAQSLRFEQLLLDRVGPGVQVVVSPVIDIEFSETSLTMGGADAVVFTSAYAVEAAGRLQGRSGLPAYCVGDRTRDLAVELGFRARSAGGTAEDLLELLTREAKDQNLLYLRGSQISRDLVEEGRQAGLRITQAIVYRQVPQALTAQAHALFAGPTEVILPVFSPRSALRLGEELSGKEKDQSRVICISSSVAAIATETGFPRCEVAKRPDADAMMDQIAASVGSGGA